MSVEEKDVTEHIEKCKAILNELTDARMGGFTENNNRNLLALIYCHLVDYASVFEQVAPVICTKPLVDAVACSCSK